MVKTALGFAAASLKVLCIEMPSSAVLCSLSAHHKDNQGKDAPRCLKSRITNNFCMKVQELLNLHSLCEFTLPMCFAP